MTLKLFRNQDDLPEHVKNIMDSRGFSDGNYVYVARREDESESEFNHRAKTELTRLQAMEDRHPNMQTIQGYEWGANTKGEQFEALSQLFHHARDEYPEEIQKQKEYARKFITHVSKQADGLDRKTQRLWQKRARRFIDTIDRQDFGIIHQYASVMAVGSGSQEGNAPIPGPEMGDGNSNQSDQETIDKQQWRESWEQDKSKSEPREVDHRSIQQAKKALEDKQQQESEESRTPRFDPLDNPNQDQGITFQVKNPGANTEKYRRLVAALQPLITTTTRTLQNLIPEKRYYKGTCVAGDEIDIGAAIEMFTDLRLGKQTEGQVYKDERRSTRDVQVGILLDMSGSMSGSKITRLTEATIVLAESLEKIGDTYSIFGFSGSYPEVDIYNFKRTEEPLDGQTRARIGSIEAKQQNRDGAAIRWMTDYMLEQPHKTNILLQISDGRPQDHNYGSGIEDTASAFKEAKARGISSRLITVDSHSESYLTRMLSEGEFKIVDSVDKLPQAISEFYQRMAT